MGDNDRPAAELSTRKRRFLAAIVASPTVRDACAAAGVAESTGWRYLSDPAVRSELAERQDSVLGHTAQRLAAEMSRALDVLVAIMNDKLASDAARVSAARCILESGLRLAELVQLAQRVSDLEQRLEARDG